MNGRISICVFSKQRSTTNKNKVYVKYYGPRYNTVEFIVSLLHIVLSQQIYENWKYELKWCKIKRFFPFFPKIPSPISFITFQNVNFHIFLKVLMEISLWNDKIICLNKFHSLPFPFFPFIRLFFPFSADLLSFPSIKI